MKRIFVPNDNLPKTITSNSLSKMIIQKLIKTIQRKHIFFLIIITQTVFFYKSMDLVKSLSPANRNLLREKQKEKEILDGVWKGLDYGQSGIVDPKMQHIHIVVSHCNKDLSWIEEFISDYTVSSIHIISKCGVPVKGAPSGSTIEVLRNVGRCDHTYAHYITSVLQDKIEPGTEKNSVAVFLKDNRHVHQSGSWSGLGGMVGLAGSDHGFACGMIPDKVIFENMMFYISSFHDTATLLNFSMNEYVEPESGAYEGDGTKFKSVYADLGEFYFSINQEGLRDTVQVCYGGVFAVSVKNIMKVDMSIWEKIEKILSRGNSIEEGHFMERSWGILLSSPMTEEQVDSVYRIADDMNPEYGDMNGALVKLFLEEKKNTKIKIKIPAYIKRQFRHLKHYFAKKTTPANKEPSIKKVTKQTKQTKKTGKIGKTRKTGKTRK